MYDGMQNESKISLVIIRIELDDTLELELDNLKAFNYKSESFLTKFNNNNADIISSASNSSIINRKSLTISIEEEDDYKKFIGKREFHNITIETYKSTLNDTIMDSGDDYETKTKHYLNNSLTMQKALETAYDDWNKNKMPHKEDYTIDDEVVVTPKDEDTQATVPHQSSTIVDESVPLLDLNEIVMNNEVQMKPIKPNLAKQLSTSSSPPLPVTTISYYFGNPSIDLVRGIIHIYKDSNLTSLDKEAVRSEMLCMIGIPSNIQCTEILDFILPYGESIEYIRVIRDTCPNQYMLILKFKSQKDADEFYKHNNNQLFNSIENNICHLVYIESIETMSSSKGAALPIPGFTELPNCYICLEKMDESLNGVITILCNHSFHASCLAKWGDTTCPVCRYTVTPDFAFDSVCTECGSQENLWVCLICGHIGCGRYVRGHAYSHFEKTQHTYSMQLGSNRVWDYAGDNYVHRLLQNKADGKLVQVDEAGRVINQDEKMDSITLEYTYLLTTQLESQRMFFEERLLKQEEQAKSQIYDLETKSKANAQENVLLKESLNNLTKEKVIIEKRCILLNTKLTKLQNDLEEEKELNKCLTANQDAYQKKLNDLEERFKRVEHEKNQEIDELKSQVRDVLFYLEAQKKLSEMDDVTQDEIKDGQVTIGEDTACSAHEKMARRRKKK